MAAFASDNAKPNVGGATVPGIGRRLACLPYEGLLVLALMLIATFPVAGLKGITLQGAPHVALQIYLSCVIAGYFIWFWRHGGQTLPMKTWRFRLVDRNGQSPSLARAFGRFLLALFFFGSACLGLVLIFFPHRISPAQSLWTFVPMIASVLWARFDADRQFLHDHLAGTRLVNANQ